MRMAAKIDEIDAQIARLRRMREELARVVGCACDSLDHCTCGAAYLARRGREPSAPVALLHVTNGESAGNTLRQTGLGGAVLSWQDVLHEGPVPAGPRRGCCAPAPASSPSAAGAAPPRSSRRSSGATGSCSTRFAAGSEVVLWFEHDLYDQLQLLDALSLAHEAEAAPELIVVGSFPGKPSFAGLGELTRRRARDALARRRAAAPETLAAAAARMGGVPRARAASNSPNGRRARSAGCPTSRPRSCGCSRSFPPPATGSPAPSGARSRPSQRARRRRSRPSPRASGSSRRRSSATRGSSAPSPALARPGRDATEVRSRRRLRSATARRSAASRSG